MQRRQTGMFCFVSKIETRCSEYERYGAPRECEKLCSLISIVFFRLSVCEGKWLELAV